LTESKIDWFIMAMLRLADRVGIDT